MLHTVIVYFIDKVDVTVVRSFYPMGNQQKRISFIRQYAVRYIFPCIQTHHGKIMNGRFITFFLQYRTRFYKRPCTVRIVIQCKFLTLSSFFQNEPAFKHAWFSTFRNFHARLDIRSNSVRSEIKYRQILQAIEGQRKHK